MKVKKVLKIMRKKYGWQGDISKEQEIFAQTIVNATLEAINYTRCCTELKALKDGKNGEGMDLVKDFNKAFRNL